MARGRNRKNYRKKQRIPLSHMVTAFISFFLFTYFSYHMLYGEMGYFSLRRVEKSLSKANLEYQELKEDRVSLENRVKRLRSDSLDLDVLDERARDILGYVKEDEVIIINN